jgi:hypothetical protein
MTSWRCYRRRVVAAAVFMLCAVASAEPPPPMLTLEWIEPPRELVQGKITLKVRLRVIAEGDVKLPEWVADGWGTNFVVFISKSPGDGKGTALPPATSRGFVKFESLTLKRGETRDIVGEFALNNEPGDYELFAQLTSAQKPRSKSIQVTVNPGRVVDTRK